MSFVTPHMLTYYLTFCFQTNVTLLWSGLCYFMHIRIKLTCLTISFSDVTCQHIELSNMLHTDFMLAVYRFRFCQLSWPMTGSVHDVVLCIHFCWSCWLASHDRKTSKKNKVLKWSTSFCKCLNFLLTQCRIGGRKPSCETTLLMPSPHTDHYWSN